MVLPRVVIVGGGFCGLSCARRLRGKAEVVLVSDHSFFEFTPGVPRLLTDSSERKGLRIDLRKALPKAQIVIGECTRITPSAVFVGRQELPYDYCVVCRGAEYPIGMKSALTVKTGEQALRAAPIIEGAKRILVVGGGLVGVEVAGELCTKTDAEITVVQPGTRLIERNPAKASDVVHSFLKKRGAKVIFGEKIVRGEKDVFFTDKGRSIGADVCLWCAGIKTDASLLSEHFASAITGKGAVKTNEFLQVEGYGSVFAGGDVTAMSEEKTAQNAERHGRLIAQNVLRHRKDLPLVPYGHFVGPLVISLGDWRGVFVWKSFVWSGIVPAAMKRAIEWWTLFKFRWL